MKNFPEIEALIKKHKQELIKNFKVKELSIFGSYARNEQKEKSDIDILVDFFEPVSLLKIISLENYLKDILKVKVDVVPKNDIRIELKERILKEAIPI